MCAAPTPQLALIFRGTFVHSTWTCPMEVLRDHLLGVSDSGKIVFLEESSQQEKLAKEWCFKPCEIRELSHHEFFMPGLVDTHIHAPQYAFAGSNVDLPLLDWLNKYTFPTEQRFQSTDVAEEVYTRVVRRTLKNGTTTACYFGTIHTDSSLILAEITDKFGQRAFVGKVCMDLNNTVPEYKETTEESVKETERFVSEMLQKNYSRVKPIVTPRFSLSCTETLMSELGNIAKTHDLYIQSHISENREEIEAVKSLYPGYKNYTDVYDKNNLLTNKTVMAHGCYLSEEELNVFSERGASIAHCPNSNLSLSSGLLNVLDVLKKKVKIGLGTDVAGGYSYSMLDAIRRAVMVSNTLLINKVNEKSHICPKPYLHFFLQFTGFPSMRYGFAHGYMGASPMWVSPFRHPRIARYLPFPVAFRSLSRLSSALSAKASALCPFLLDLAVFVVPIFLHSRFNHVTFL